MIEEAFAQRGLFFYLVLLPTFFYVMNLGVKGTAR